MWIKEKNKKGNVCDFRVRQEIRSFNCQYKKDKEKIMNFIFVRIRFKEIKKRC